MSEQEYQVPPENFQEFLDLLKQGKKNGTVVIKNLTMNNNDKLQKENDALQAEIERLKAQQRWIPVSERLPDDTRVYDVAISGYQYSWTGSCVFGKWIGESGKALLGITHWKYRQTLPEVDG